MSYVLAATNAASGTLVLIGFELLALLFWLRMGIVYMRHPEQRQYRGQTSQAMQLQKQIRQWGIVLEGEQATETMQELKQSWNAIQPFLAQYIIILLVLLTFLVNTISLNFSLHGQPETINQFWTFATLAIFALIILITRGSSYIAGVTQLRQKTQSTLSYGDLQRRSANTYRNSLFRGLSAAFVLITLIMTLLLPPYLHTLQYPGTVLLQGTWIASGLTVLMIAVAIIAELLIQRIATLPRSLVTARPSIAREVDDLFRAQVISQIQGDEAITLAFLFVAQWFLLLMPILNRLPVFLSALVFLGLGLCGISYIVGLTAYLCRGRLGGTVTGWPWQYRKMQ